MILAIGLFAGLGFIFIGTQFLTANMKQVAGPGFRRLVSRATGHPLKAMLAGIAAGAVIQSTNAVTFIVISLVTGGVATVRSAMPIVTWSYAGSTLRLLLASLDIHAAVMTGVGLIGLAYLFGYDREAKYRNLVAAMLGLVLLLYGVQIMVEACRPLSDSQTLREILAAADSFYLWGFIAGTALAAVIQGQTVSVIAVALVSGGVLDLDQTILIVVGANLGSGIMTIIQGAGLTGTARQLNLYQFVLKLIGVAALLPLLMLEHFAGVPLIEAFVTSFTDDPGLQVTAVHWMFQIVSAVLASLFSTPLFALIERMSPESLQESLAKPRFILSDERIEAQTGIVMTEQEQLRLLRRLPYFLTKVRPEADDLEDAAEPQAVTASPAILSQCSEDVRHAVTGFLKQQLQTASGPAEEDRLLRLWSCNEILKSLFATFEPLAQSLSKLRASDQLAPFAGHMAEATHALTRTIAEELSERDEETAAFLAALTADRSSVMRKMREEIWTSLPDLSVSDRQNLWSAMDLFEQSVWLLQRYAMAFNTNASEVRGAIPSR